jgi:hypothetical protein
MEVTFTLKPKAKRKSDGPCAEAPDENIPAGSIPRVSRLMALAIRFESLVRRGEVRDYADLARLGYVTRARITQIMNLTNLAPDIQEEILFLPNTQKGRDPVLERELRPIAAVPHWPRQRKMWAQKRRDGVF